MVTIKSPAVKRKSPPGDSVRTRLLKSAQHLFAKSGYDGVAVDEIVRRAGVNKRMVYHYFGSKEGLYGEVLRTVFAELEEIEMSLFEAGDPVKNPERALEETVAAYFSFLRNHPAFVRLLLWENLNEGRHLRTLERPVTKSPMLSHLTRVLEAGEKSGRFRRKLDPNSVLVSLIGLCLVYFSNRHTLTATLGLNLSDEGILSAAAQHSSAILLHGIVRSKSRGKAQPGDHR